MVARTRPWNDVLRRRIDEAAQYVPREHLCLSPQCGFSSTHHGNSLTEEDQWAKLARVVEVAGRIGACEGVRGRQTAAPLRVASLDREARSPHASGCEQSRPDQSQV